MKKPNDNLFFPAIDLPATGQNIKRLRYSQRLTIRDLQDYFGFDAPQAIYRWERGEALPSVDNLVALGNLFGVPVDSILIKSKVPTVDIKDFGLIYVFRGKACWVVYKVLKQ